MSADLERAAIAYDPIAFAPATSPGPRGHEGQSLESQERYLEARRASARRRSKKVILAFLSMDEAGLEALAKVIMLSVDRNGRPIQIDQKEFSHIWQTTGMRDYYIGQARAVIAHLKERAET